mmetsp:Transcript_34673/g.53118  ORF Transcript_34673/g.53118 Transcript_34673/m.53118 type:complete len:432 (-) Transcript_34673:998-2293(-)
MRGADTQHTLQQTTTPLCYNGFTFKKLWLKLVFEQMASDLQYNQNFGALYEFIKQFGTDLEYLKLRVIDKTGLKSNHYWLMAIIPKLKSLKSLTLFKDCEWHSFDNGGFKFLSKAMKYFHDNGGDLQRFHTNNIVMNGYSGDYLYQSLKFMPNIRVLDFSHDLLSLEDCKGIGKVLSDFKSIVELNLSNTQLVNVKAKEIADGLMRAKQLEILNLSNNPSIDCYQIIYNMAFSPKIKHIDLTNVPKANTSDTAEAIYKLLKISGSIRTLLMGGTNIGNRLPKDFFVVLGENKTLEHLNLDFSSGTLSTTNIEYLGKGCAMNKYKNGSLVHLSVRKAFSSDTQFNNFLQHFYISEHCHEQWYGDSKVAKEMKNDQLEKKLHCGLSYLNFEGSALSSNGFKFKHYEKQPNPKWPQVVKFMANTKIQGLDLSTS